MHAGIAVASIDEPEMVAPHCKCNMAKQGSRIEELGGRGA